MRTKNVLRVVGIILLFPILGGAASDCLGVSKVDGANGGSGSTAGNLIQTCPGGASFEANANTAFQDKCVTCHTTGTANSLFPLVAGTNLSGDQMDANYAAAQKQLLANDNGDITTNPILANPLGKLNGHTTVFTSGADPDYVSLTQWVSDELASPCTTTATGN